MDRNYDVLSNLFWLGEVNFVDANKIMLIKTSFKDSTKLIKNRDYVLK